MPDESNTRSQAGSEVVCRAGSALQRIAGGLRRHGRTLRIAVVAAAAVSVATYVVVHLIWAKRLRGDDGHLVRSAGALPDAVVKEEVVDLGGGNSLALVFLATGTFRMGSIQGAPDELPVHDVSIRNPFAIGKYEVTVGQWNWIMHGTNVEGYDAGLPIEASWDQCEEFLKRLSARVGEGTFRMPSEAEWEYACRAGSSARWSCGNDRSLVSRYSNYDCSVYASRIRVGSLKSNAWGLYDMHGNVEEWCRDVYRGRYDSELGCPADGSAWERVSGDVAPVDEMIRRVKRGGGYLSTIEEVRSSSRDSASQTGKGRGMAGLRVAWEHR